MTEYIAPGQRSGSVEVPASKSQAHRLLIAAALGTGETEISCDGISRDISATIACLNALGADISDCGGGLLRVRPIQAPPRGARALSCGESGSTLRFLLPVAGALGAEAEFHMEGRLPQRPLAPLDGELISHGMDIALDGDVLRCRGKLTAGNYSIPGNISSQYISGLLLALPYLEGDSVLTVTGDIESGAYISMTEDALRLAGIDLGKSGRNYVIKGGQRARLPERLRVEGDYSNAAFFLCIGALSEKGVTVSGLSENSLQGDRAALDILRRFGAEVETDGQSISVRGGRLRGCVIDAAPIPDLIPALSAVAAAAEGETRVINAARLRLKESDRLSATARMLNGLGGDVTELEDGLIIRGGKGLSGGKVDSCGDHRIAMSAAVAACVCSGPVAVDGSECVQKSYPRFWRDYGALTGGEV